MFYKLFDSFSAGQLLAVVMSTFLLGIGIFLVLDSAEETPGVDVAELVNDSDENESKVCVQSVVLCCKFSCIRIVRT